MTGRNCWIRDMNLVEFAFHSWSTTEFHFYQPAHVAAIRDSAINNKPRGSLMTKYKFAKELYSKIALLKAAYCFTDTCYILSEYLGDSKDLLKKLSSKAKELGCAQDDVADADLQRISLEK